MNEEKAAPYIFSLYQEHDTAVQVFADAKCRRNRSEAVRRMIEYAEETLFPQLGIERPVTPAQEQPA